MQQLNVIDAAMLATETPRTPNHLCMVQIYDPSTAPDGQPSFARIQAKLEACLPELPSLRRRLAHVPFEIDRPYWVDDADFDLEFHVRQLALPRPGDWRQFRIQVARLASRPVDLARPPWEITVIEGLDEGRDLPPGCFATVLKVHHAAIDGQSGMELLNVIHDLDPATPFEPGGDGWVPHPVPSTTDLLRRAAANALANPAQAFRAVAANVLPVVREIAGAGRSLNLGSRAERTRFNHRVSAHRTWDEVRCSLADLKKVKQRVAGSTINDVCLSVVGGSMHSYLSEQGEPPGVPLTAMVPVSTRTPEKAKAGGNQVSAIRVSMHTDIADPLARIAAIHAETAAAKAAQNGVAVSVLLDVAHALPGALIGAAVRGALRFNERAPVAANTIVTNVPGSQEPLYFLGCKLVRFTACLPLADGIGLFHCVGSLADDFMFLFTADRDMLPDPGPYRDHLTRSIAAHFAAADVAAVHAAEPRRKATGTRSPAGSA
jgi:diacylglycerol O-acyltransferase